MGLVVMQENPQKVGKRKENENEKRGGIWRGIEIVKGTETEIGTVRGIRIGRGIETRIGIEKGKGTVIGAVIDIVTATEIAVGGGTEIEVITIVIEAEVIGNENWSTKLKLYYCTV